MRRRQGYRGMAVYVNWLYVCFTNVLTLHFSPAACVEAANAQSLKCMDYRSCCGLFQHRGQWIKPNMHFTSVEERKSSYQAQNRSVERPLWSLIVCLCSLHIPLPPVPPSPPVPAACLWFLFHSLLRAQLNCVSFMWRLKAIKAKEVLGALIKNAFVVNICDETL